MPIKWFPRSPPPGRRGLGVYVALQNTCFSRKICSYPNNRCQPGPFPEVRWVAAGRVLTPLSEGRCGLLQGDLRAGARERARAPPDGWILWLQSGLQAGLCPAVEHADERTRTSTGSPPHGPEPCASASSATSAWR